MVKHALASGLLLASLMTQGCGGARPYAAMYKSASSELSATAQARDHRLKIHLREALVEEQGFSGLILSPYVFMERGYVVGHVDKPEQAEAVLRTARRVAGLRSVDGYLPVKPSSVSNSTTSTTSDVTLKAQIESALAIAPGVVKSRVNVDVLDGQVVLLGIVSGDEERLHAEQAASVNGVKGITNWLLLPESEYMSIRPRVR
jgi:osmotically-inducible protein OsmY